MFKTTDDITVIKNQVKARKNLIEGYELIQAMYEILLLQNLNHT